MEIEDQQQGLIFAELKKTKQKKILLEIYIDSINENINNDINIQKNKIILKTLYTNMKNINENNIIMVDSKITRIEGLDISEDGLLILNNNLYKNKKKMKILSTK